MQNLPQELSQYPLVPVDNGPTNLPIPARVAGLTPEVITSLAPLMNSQLRLNEVNTRVSALRETSIAQAAMASDWLRNRAPGERGIEIELYAESRERRWLFAEGERLIVRTQITIR